VPTPSFSCLIYELSRNSVVPMFLRLRRGGSMDQWLLELMATHEDEHDFSKRVGPPSGHSTRILGFLHLPRFRIRGNPNI
jgi:hypothetical protein